jgi:formylglycine-generating enzyme required for sulfatase activity
MTEPRTTARVARMRAGASSLQASSLVAVCLAASLEISCDSDTASTTDPLICSHDCAFECGFSYPDNWDDECVNGLFKDQVVIPVCDESRKACYREFVPSCSGGFCRVPAGSWLAGRRNPMQWSDYPRFPVILTRAFEVSETEVTVEEWLAVMGGGSPSSYECGSDCPVTHITLFDALEYANRVSAASGYPVCYEMAGCVSDIHQSYGRECNSVTFFGPDCAGYRLPSEMEWELAANAGNANCISGAPVEPIGALDVDRSCQGWADSQVAAWYCGNSAVSYGGCMDLSGNKGPTCAGPSPVRQHPPNSFGLYDMHGNVAELTGTLYTWPWTIPSTPYPERLSIDPGFDLQLASDYLDLDLNAGTGEEPSVVVRGGSFALPLYGICAASRSAERLGRTLNGISFSGFRLVRTVSDP